MLYIFMGPSCTGKSTAVKRIKEILDVEVFTGKDYLRMAKDENEAWQLFYDKLRVAASSAEDSAKDAIIYLITEKEELMRIADIENACRIRFTAPLETVKERFSHRMNGRLPQPVEKMLERQYTDWEDMDGDLIVNTSQSDDLKKIIELFEVV